MLSDSEILNYVRRESYAAESYVRSEVAEEREDTLERYLGESYGDEQEGRSKVISRDVFETVEWAMPSFLRIFASGDDVVEYQPEGPEDEQFAEQCTDVANYVFYKQNPGFLLLYTWFKDALLAKQGVLKSWWHETETVEDEEWTGLSDDEYMLLISEDDVTVKAHTAYTLDGTEIEDDDETPTDEFGMPLPVLHDVEISRKIVSGQIKTEAVPPEEFYMSRDAMDPDAARYLEHRSTKTASELIEAGFDRDLVEQIPGDEDSNNETGEHAIRMGQQETDEGSVDPSMRQIEVKESYLYLDDDEDGIAERHKVIWGGEVILDKEKMADQPFSVIQPIPIPHRAYGFSFGDVVADLQRIKTTLMRQTLDNLYLSNNPEREVDINKVVSMDDFLMSRAGGIKRVKEIGASREISTPFVAQHSFAMLDGVDSMISARTGISDAVTGVDAEVLQNETATASNNQLAQANQRIEAIARIFADTGFKHLFRLYLKLMVKHQDKPMVIRLRNEWVQVDPRVWNANMDVSVNVGLGHGSREQQSAQLMGLMNWQREILSDGGLGMVRPKHIYNTFEKLVKAAGFKSIDPFMDDPGDQPLQMPQQQDPNAALIQGQMQIEGMKLQGKQAEVQAKSRLEIEKAHIDHKHEMHKLEYEYARLEVEREKIAASMKETAAKIDADKDKAAAQLFAQSEKLRHEAEKDEAHRRDHAREKAQDRETALAAAAQKAQRTIRLERGADGSLSGVSE